MRSPIGRATPRAPELTAAPQSGLRRRTGASFDLNAATQWLGSCYAYRIFRLALGRIKPRLPRHMSVNRHFVRPHARRSATGEVPVLREPGRPCAAGTALASEHRGPPACTPRQQVGRSALLHQSPSFRASGSARTDGATGGKTFEPAHNAPSSSISFRRRPDAPPAAIAICIKAFCSARPASRGRSRRAPGVSPDPVSAEDRRPSGNPGARPKYRESFPCAPQSDSGSSSSCGRGTSRP